MNKYTFELTIRVNVTADNGVTAKAVMDNLVYDVSPDENIEGSIHQEYQIDGQGLMNIKEIH